MHFFATITTALLGACHTMAVPASKLETRQATLCPSLEFQPQCCAVDISGIVGIQCAARAFSLLSSKLYSLSV